MSTIDAVLERQTDLYGLINRALLNWSKVEKKKRTAQRVKARNEALTSKWKKFQNNHDSLTALQPAAKKELAYFTSNLYDKCEEAYFDSIEELSDILEELKAASERNNTIQTTQADNNAPSSRQLPRINLPRFSGSYREWRNFRDLFGSMIKANREISDVEKLQYLKMCVTDEAAKLVANIDVIAENFARAWQVLVDRYEIKRVLIDTHLATLFSIKKVNQHVAQDLKTLHGDVKEALGALEALGCPIEAWNYILVYVVTRCLDSDTLIDWEKQNSSTTEPPTFAELEAFLLSRIHALEAVARVTTISKPRSSSSKTSGNASNAKSHQTSVTTVKSHNESSTSDQSKTVNHTCSSCGSDHYLSSCPEFKNKTLEQRQAFVVQNHLCFNCLGPHQVRNCRTTKRCRVCNKTHHTLLHSSDLENSHKGPGMENAGSTSASSVSENQTASPRISDHLPAASHHVNATQFQCMPVMLATALVKVISASGETYEVRALLDQGSEVSFITTSLANRLNLNRKRISLPIIGIGNHQSVVSRALVTLNVSSRVKPKFSVEVNAYVLANLTSYLPPSQKVKREWTHLRELELADPTFSSATKIDLVLGAEVYGQIIEDGLRKGETGTPIAQKTTFGWILSGPVSCTSSLLENHKVNSFQCSVDNELLELLTRFWAQEETSASKKPPLSDAEMNCEQHFEKIHSRTSEGRYVVRIPFKKNIPDDLGNSYTAALSALFSQEQRFEKNASLKSAYTTFLAEYEDLGHMTLASPATAQPRRVFYLPHHAVFRDCSSTTTVRVVFNGSQKTTLGLSINDLQHAGPKLQNEITDVITRWRIHAYVFSADIEKMYRQILVHPVDRDIQRILWRTDPKNPPQQYQLCTVTYGLASAPYLAIRTSHQLASDEERSFPLAVSVIRHDMYVDDVFSGADEISEAQEKIRQVDACLNAGGFLLKKWTANAEDMLKYIPPERQQQNSHVTLENDSLVRTLGISWNPKSDSFIFSNSNVKAPVNWTKRTVLSRVAQLYDPLGWIAPIVVLGKIFIQQMWIAGLDWDDSLSTELASEWEKYFKDLQDIATISVPRWFGFRRSSIAIELHGFADASQAALGAVIYIRVMSDLDAACVSLVAAKTRVAPLKKVTIPRLELSAAVLLVRQISHIRKVLELTNSKIHLWTDSTIALAYISSDPRRWAEYVQIRVTEIQDLANSQWHHVSGSENPADCASRGLSPRELKENRLWWAGPEWLSKHSTSWPSTIPTLDPDIALETRKTQVNLTTQPEFRPVWDLIQRFSNLRKLVRVTAWCMRACSKFRNSRDSTNQGFTLTPAELDKSRLFWVKEIQTTHFKKERDLLSQGKQLPRSTSLIRLSPFLDEAGLIRVGGRLQNALLDDDEKHPLILPRASEFTTLVIDEVHRRTLHGGTQVTLATLRRQYWIVGGRVPIRAFIHRCVKCVRQRASTGQQLMGQLPKSRVLRSRPFLHSGGDYAGPINLRTFRGRGAKSYKGYIVVFVCLSSSALHIEIATDYSTAGFIAAYKRFTGRRGICETLTSDCGTNFIGADSELRKLFKAASASAITIANLLANDGTRWIFNPPSAPHFGGKWEAAVKSVKYHIKRVIGDTGLTYEEYMTLLTQIEAILNSRPLCPLSDDPSDLTTLTPGHFLIGSALNSIPEPALIDLPSSRLSRWQLLRQITERFWQRWSTEYLQHLQAISKWQRPFNTLKVGSLVIVKDERYPPSKWALGRVIELHPGKDNLVRVATVRTQYSIYKRPIVKLCLLPISTDNDYAKYPTPDLS